MQHRKTLGIVGIALTFFKLPLAGGIVALLLIQNDGLAATSIFLLMIFDIFDGVLFRYSTYSANIKLGKLRRSADSIGDVLVVNAVLITMIFSYDFPVGFYLITLVRSALAGALAVRAHTLGKPIWKTNLSSRLAAFSTGLMAIAWLLGETGASYFCAGLIVIFGAIGLAQHYKTIQARVSP